MVRRYGAFVDVHLDDRFARDLAGLYEPWQAAVPPAPSLLALNHALATDLGFEIGRAHV